MARTKIVPHGPHYHPAKKNDSASPRRHNIEEATTLLPPAKFTSTDKKSHTTEGRLTSPQSSNKTSFLDLAPELRNRIYGHLLIPDTTKIRLASIVRGNGRLAVKQLRSKSTVAPSVSILSTCHQIHQEATPMLYDNYFGFQSGSDTEIFLHKIGHSIKDLRHVKIETTASPIPVVGALKLLSHAKGLQTLEFGRSVRSGFTIDALAQAVEPLMVMLAERRGKGIWEVLRIAPAKGLEGGFEQLMEEWETAKYEDSVKLALYERMS